MSSVSKDNAAVVLPPEPKVVVNAGMPQQAADAAVVFLQPDQMQWRKILPAMGENSPKVAVVRHLPETGATTQLIWTPPNFHVPLHWHSGNEKHVVVRGTFIFQCQGERVTLRAGSFNYMPARMVHEAWTPPDDDCLLLTDVDTLWDIHWVGSPPAFLG